jgi:hypothetical protein
LAGAKDTAAFLDINQKGVVSTAPARTIVILTFLVLGSNPLALIGCHSNHSCKCIRYGLDIQFRREHFVQLPALI